MATETWHYQENQFDNATDESFKKMNIINADHLAKLQAQQGDPDIAALLARTTAPHDAYNLRYSSWLSAKATYKGKTNHVDGYIDDLRTLKIKQWDIQVQQQFLEGSSDYIAILPGGRGPFQIGGIDERISQLQSLAQRLSAYPTLAATMNDVTAFHATLDGARDLQQQKEQLVEDASDLLETARKDIALMMYRNLGFLMDKYGSTPQVISNFWELQLLRASVSDDDQTLSGRSKSAATGNPLPFTKVTVMNAEGVQVGEPVFTDENASYIKGTDVFGAAFLEFDHPQHVKKTISVIIPEGGSLIQDAELEPLLPPPPPPPQ